MTPEQLSAITYRLIEKGNRLQKVPRNVISAVTGANSLRKAKKALPLSYNKTKNYAKSGGAVSSLVEGSTGRTGRMLTDLRLGIGFKDGARLNRIVKKGLSGKSNYPNTLRSYGLGELGTDTSIGLAKMTEQPILRKARENELKRLGALTGGGAAAGVATPSALDALEKTSSWKVQMSPANKLLAGGALAGLVGSKLLKANNARKFINTGTSNKPLDILLNRNAINANKVRGTRPGLGYNKKLDDLAGKENLKSTIARLGLGGAIGAGAYTAAT